MKRNLLIILTCFFVLTNCSLNDDNNSDDTVVFTTWHLINVTGGIAGVDDTFDLETIIWSFDGTDGVITVVNNNTDDTKIDGLDSGTYDFSILDEGGDEFLVVENNEMGLLTLTQSYLEIDENVTSEGDVADGFIYTFKKVLEVQE